MRDLAAAFVRPFPCASSPWTHESPSSQHPATPPLPMQIEVPGRPMVGCRLCPIVQVGHRSASSTACSTATHLAAQRVAAMLPGLQYNTWQLCLHPRWCIPAPLTASQCSVLLVQLAFADADTVRWQWFRSRSPHQEQPDAATGDHLGWERMQVSGRVYQVSEADLGQRLMVEGTAGRAQGG